MISFPERVTGTVSEREVRAAVDRATAALLERQRPDGSWSSPSDQGPSVAAATILTLNWLGELRDSEARGVARYLRACQLADGAFEAWPTAGRGEVGTTALAAAALRAGGDPDAAALADSWVEANGGPKAIVGRLLEGDTAAIFLALNGDIPAAELPAVPMAWTLIPGIRALAASFVHDGVPLVAATMGLIRKSLVAGHPPAGCLAQAEARRALAMMEGYRNDDGSYLGFVPFHLLCLAALRSAGVADHRFEEGVSWLHGQFRERDGGLTLSAYEGDVWSTGMTVRTLIDGGLPASHPAIVRAADWLVETQSMRPQPRSCQRRRHAPRIGGWGFAGRNQAMCDTDDAGMAIRALNAVRRGGVDDPRYERAVELGLLWLRGMQNPDGGWSAFTWNLGRRNRGAMSGHPLRLPRSLHELRELHGSLADPSYEDITGRLLDTFGDMGIDRSDPMVERAVRFLGRQQCPDGAFYGRWLTAYIVGSGHSLAGLVAAGVSSRSRAVRRVCAWAESHQNADGGWGETAWAYIDPSLAGKGESTPSHTGTILGGLLRARGRSDPAVSRGIRYLVDSQREDGTWLNGNFTQRYNTPDQHYTFEMAPLLYPPEALTMWLRQREPSWDAAGNGMTGII